MPGLELCYKLFKDNISSRKELFFLFVLCLFFSTTHLDGEAKTISVPH